MHDTGEVILEFVELASPRTEVIILERHQEQGLIVGCGAIFAVDSTDGKLRDAVLLAELIDPF
jgi:hypothetical protein